MKQSRPKKPRAKAKLKMSKQILKFPNGFLWGAASSAYQTEGNNIHSDWWSFEHSIKRIEFTKTRDHEAAQYISGDACDGYNRFDEDFALAEHLHHNSTRFGIEWSRLEPEEGRFAEEEWDHYEKVLQSAKFHNLTVFLTLHHFTVPVWLAKKGGFAKRRNLKYFERFAQMAAKRLGQYVDFWITINEPEVYATHSYLLGIFPPQKKSFFRSLRVINNMIRLHNRLAPMLKFQTGKPVSMAFHLADLEPAGFLGGMAKSFAHYAANEYILRRTIKYCDYIGVNYYEHHHLGILGFRKHSHTNHDHTDLGWGIHPEGLERVLMYVKGYNKPIYITENGLADAKDLKREKYIKDHLYFVHRAIQAGADVRGYLYWSLTDNFEWQHGFWPRFGLIEIDREDLLRRKVRYSALKYGEICKNNSMEHEPPQT